MGKRFWISVVVLFVVSMALGFAVHEAMLGAEYRKLGSLFRAPADAEKYFPWMLLAHLFLSCGFAWIYVRGREDKPFVGQGIRFGIAVAVLTAVPTYLIYYAVQPMPGDIVVRQIVFDTIGYVIMGVVCAWINRTA